MTNHSGNPHPAFDHSPHLLIRAADALDYVADAWVGHMQGDPRRVPQWRQIAAELRTEQERSDDGT